MIKKVLIGVGILVGIFVLNFAYFMFPYYSLVWRLHNFKQNFKVVDERARTYCPDYAGTSPSECYIEFVRRYEARSEGYTLGLVLLSMQFVGVVMEEGAKLNKPVDRITNMFHLGDGLILFLEKADLSVRRTEGSSDVRIALENDFAKKFAKDLKKHTQEIIEGVHKSIEKEPSLTEIERVVLVSRVAAQLATIGVFNVRIPALSAPVQAAPVAQPATQEPTTDNH